ncbi:CPBP family intramembrane metalloprotease [Xanthomonadaceae bacterium XH05]|nr:CPBP family intramembrane metalloprotease [Xanthomonadaceae bacterium XH05]
MNRVLPPVRLALVALATVLLFWCVSHLTVATWLASAANQRDADWAQGLSPWQWSFSGAGSVIRPGSHGLISARHEGGGLSFSLPDEGVASMSLPIDGGHIDLNAVDRARIELHASAPLHLRLMPHVAGLHPEWASAVLGAGAHRLDLPLSTMPAPVTDALHLRIEAASGTMLHLRGLALLATSCDAHTPCPPRRDTAPPLATPERLLAYIDAQRRIAPAVAIEPEGRFGDAGRWLATRLQGASDGVVRVVGMLLLALVLLAVTRRLRRRPSASPRRAVIELAATLGGALMLLLSGWPAPDTSLQAGIALALCLAALALLPPPSRHWCWNGDAASWKSAIMVTVIALLAISPLALLDHGDAVPRDASRWVRYPLWALVQQWLLIAAIAPRVRLVTSDTRSAALACGALFALMHAPNFTLMIATLIGGSLWAWLGYRHRALLPLAVSHAALGLWLVHLAPTWVLRSAEVGGRYLMAP